MGCPPERKIIHSLKLVDHLYVQADNPWCNYYLTCLQWDELSISKKTVLFGSKGVQHFPGVGVKLNCLLPIELVIFLSVPVHDCSACFMS